MPKRVIVLVGTKKGLFLFESDESRCQWVQRGPLCESWPISQAIINPADGHILAGGGNAWYGPAVWRSPDLGQTWTHSSEGIAYGEGEEPVVNVWSLQASADGTIYAGVEPAGLFASRDGGGSWRHLEALRSHPSRPTWMPGAGGLILHSIAVDPVSPNRIWIAISVAGTFYSEDGGESWEPRNNGVPGAGPNGGDETGQCVHHLELAANSGSVLYQQNHMGMFASSDGGKSWRELTNGLPSTFGFGLAVHPRDTGSFYLAPLNGDAIGRFMPDGAAAVYRSRDGGQSFQALRRGLPQDGAFFGVLRQALTTDTCDPVGVYMGTNTGHLFASADDGESWSQVAEFLPPILSVSTAVIDR